MVSKNFDFMLGRKVIFLYYSLIRLSFVFFLNAKSTVYRRIRYTYSMMFTKYE